MTDDVTIDGYIKLHEAVRRLADIMDYTETDFDWLDIGDRLEDAGAVDQATRRIRLVAANGELKGYFFVGDGKPRPVSEGTWTEHEACLVRAGKDMGFEDLWHFHSRGLEVENGVRRPVFFIEREFETFRRGNSKAASSMVPREKRPRGRPRGVGAFDDNRWLLEIDKLVKTGIGAKTAANSVVAAHANEIGRMPGIPDESVAQRLYRKWSHTRDTAR